MLRDPFQHWMGDLGKAFRMQSTLSAPTLAQQTQRGQGQTAGISPTVQQNQDGVSNSKSATLNRKCVLHLCVTESIKDSVF